MSPEPGGHRQLLPGEPARRGSDGVYRRLRYGPEEPRLRRLELAPERRHPERHPKGDPEGAPPTARRSLLHVVQFTDIHTVDVQSPGRFEFMERCFGRPGTPRVSLRVLLPAWRPQEALNLRACEAMVRAVNRIEASPETGAPLQLVICTGDSIDNQQQNELSMFLALMEGGTVAPGPVEGGYEGVQSLEWGDPHYWQPDRSGAGQTLDRYKSRWGFPEWPGLLEEAMRSFRAEGVCLPWLSCYGNHDALILGAARATEAFEEILTGSRKARLLPPGYDPLEHLPDFVMHPETLLTGPGRCVTPDPTRRAIARREFVEAHLQAGGEPSGHGFTRENAERETAYYVYDAHSQVRMVVLDTTNPGGNFQGSVGVGQLAWLEERLAEVHARYYDVEGRLVSTGREDRLVVLCSHHGMASLIPPLVPLPPLQGEGHDLPRALGPEVEALLHRFPNVVLWINGDIHHNLIHPRPDPSGRTAGFWEVTTASLIAWPSETRRVEIVSNADGSLSILCSMVGHGAPADPRAAAGLERLASLHRELAANDPHAGVERGLAGRPEDRTVALVLPAPFDLE